MTQDNWQPGMPRVADGAHSIRQRKTRLRNRNSRRNCVRNARRICTGDKPLLESAVSGRRISFCAP